MQQVAEAATQDGLNHSDVIKLGRLGTSGLHKSNIYPQLMQLISPCAVITTALRSIVVQTKISFMRTLMVAQSILDPHELFAILYHKFPTVFRKRILGGDATRIARFWHEVRNHPALLGHPLRNHSKLRTHAVPLAVYADGMAAVAVSKIYFKNAQIYSWRTLIGRGSTLLRMFLIFLIVKTSATAQASDQFWSRLAWSLTALQNGTWPARDENNEPINYSGGPSWRKAGLDLAGGFFAPLFNMHGDLDNHASDLHLANCLSNTPCFLCRASRRQNDRPWTDFKRTAECLKTTWQPRTWLANHPHRHRVFRIPGVSVLMAIPDTMHCKHGGTDAYFFGSILKYLVFFIMTGSVEVNLTNLMQMILAWPLHKGFVSLKVSMFAGDGFPCLKGRTSSIKSFGPSLLYACQQLLDQSLLVNRQIVKALQCNIRREQILDENNDAFALSPSAANDFQENTFDYLAYLTAISHHFETVDLQANEARKRHLFYLSVKCHYLVHIALMSGFQNPSMGMCYIGEDLLGRMKKILQMCWIGTAPRSVPSKVVRRYCIAIEYLLQRDNATEEM